MMEKVKAGFTSVVRYCRKDVREVASDLRAVAVKAGTAVASAVVTALAVGTSYPASAAGGATYLDSSVQTLFSNLQSDFGLLVSYIWPVLILVLGTFVAFKWTRKGSGKL